MAFDNGINVVVSCAGIVVPTSIEELDVDIVAVSVFSTWSSVGVPREPMVVGFSVDAIKLVSTPTVFPSVMKVIVVEG